MRKAAARQRRACNTAARGDSGDLMCGAQWAAPLRGMRAVGIVAMESHAIAHVSHAVTVAARLLASRRS